MNLFTGRGQALVFVTFTEPAYRLNAFCKEIYDDTKEGTCSGNFTDADLFISDKLRWVMLRRALFRLYTYSLTTSGP